MELITTYAAHIIVAAIAGLLGAAANAGIAQYKATNVSRLMTRTRRDLARTKADMAALKEAMQPTTETPAQIAQKAHDAAAFAEINADAAALQ